MEVRGGQQKSRFPPSSVGYFAPPGDDEQYSSGARSPRAHADPEWPRRDPFERARQAEQYSGRPRSDDPFAARTQPAEQYGSRSVPGPRYPGDSYPGEQAPQRRARHGRPPTVESYPERQFPDQQYQRPSYPAEPHREQYGGQQAYQDSPYHYEPYQERQIPAQAYQRHPYPDQYPAQYSGHYPDQFGGQHGGQQGSRFGSQYQDRPPDRRERYPEAELDYPRVQALEASRPGSRSSGQSHRRRKPRRGPYVASGMLVITAGALYGLDVKGYLPRVGGSPPAAAAQPHSSATDPAAAPVFGLSPTMAPLASVTPGEIFPELPGIGTTYGSQIPANSTQVVVAYGDSFTGYTTTVDFFTKVSTGWQLQNTWAGHNGDGGWVTLANRTEGDLKSPIGVYTLTDAGGKLANPGTKLSYVQSASFVDYGKGFLGESLLNAFNYVIAINYNHEAGTSPESTYYPLGAAKGGGVWIHVDHGGPTHACISIPQDGVKALLVTLDPADNPVIVMGDRADLASNS